MPTTTLSRSLCVCIYFQMMFTLDVSHWNIFNAYNFKYFFFWSAVVSGCLCSVWPFWVFRIVVSSFIYIYTMCDFIFDHLTTYHLTLCPHAQSFTYIFFSSSATVHAQTLLYIYIYIHSVSQTPKLLWKLNCKYYRGGDLPYGLPAIHGLRVGNMYLFSVTFLFGVFFFSCSLLSYVSRLTTVIHLECSYRKP